MQITPIHSAEAIVEAFWDPELRQTDRWDWNANERAGTRVLADWWCSVNFEWQSAQPNEPVLTVSREYTPALDVTRYDTLLLSVMVPLGCRVFLSAKTDSGEYSVTSEPFGGQKQELPLWFGSAKTIQKISVSILASEKPVGTGWFNWIGLQDSARLQDHLAQFTGYDSTWDGALLGEETPISFSPRYGIFFSAEELEKMRKLYQDKRAAGCPSPFAPNTDYPHYFEPEACINDYVNFWDDTRYCRVRDFGKYLIRNGLRAALYGILEKDAASLRLAARYAMSILSCTHWDDGFICDFGQGGWEHRCFVQSLCLYDLVFIYDVAHEYFTPAAKSRLFRRLACEGLASINYNTWRHEYIFHNNQLIWFSHGRMAAYALLCKEWPRAARYMDLAYEDVIENIRNTVLPDGGYAEGPTYFTCVGQNGGQALYLYARAKQQPIEELIPQNLRATVRFADALLSTDIRQDMIPICDASPILPQSHLAFMAYLLKDSAWPGLFHKAVQRSGGIADDYFALIVQSMDIPEKNRRKAFVELSEQNITASHRILNGKDVKMLVMGNRANSGHNHEDKGSFILEYAGQTFAMDPGTCDYSSPYSLMYQQCQRHNMLVPAGGSVRAAAQSPCEKTITIRAQGDEESFSATLEAGKAFPLYYKHWTRTIHSPTPQYFTITDDFALYDSCDCDHVEFLWNTRLPVHIEADRVILCGDSGKITIHIPEGTTCEQRTLEMFGGETSTQIAFIYPQKSGCIQTSWELS